MTNQVFVKSSEPSFIKQIDIVSNKNNKTVSSIVNGTIRLMYYESILQDSIRASVTFVDSGMSIFDDKGISKTVLEGLPIVGQEKVDIKFEDNNQNELKLTLYVNKVTPVYDDTTKQMVQLDLVSREFILNEKVRLNTRFDGKISDHIRKILTNNSYLGTAKNIDIEETSNDYNFIGNNRKPYYTMNWLSKKAVSASNQKKGDSAGYFFFETSDGFKFKSIDGLLSQKKKKSITESPMTIKSF